MNKDDDLDLGTITDPAAQHVLADHRALRIEHEALVVEHRTTLAENAALRAELAQLKGAQGQPRIMPKKASSGDRLPRGRRRREAEREAAMREASQGGRTGTHPAEGTPPDAT